MIDALKVLVTLPFLLVVLWIGFANRADVFFVWTPLREPDSFPLALLLVGSVFFGFLWGSLILWINTLPMHSESRARKREIVRLQKDLAESSTAPASPSTKV